MCALPRAIAVTTEYQRDSSSKRPRASVVFAAPPPTVGGPRGGHGVQGFAPRGRRLRRPWTPRPPRGQRLVCQQAGACCLSPNRHRRIGAWQRVIPYQCPETV